VIKREAGKFFKMTYNSDAAYAEYTNETPIPVITGVPGTISALIRKYSDHIPVKHDTKELQNTATKGTQHILLKVRMLSTRRSSWEITVGLHGPHIVTTEQLQQHTP
jgi:hypothetical protein